jgi:hypothetical protein
LIAAAKASSDPELPVLIEEANELSAIFNQSQFTARMNQRGERSRPRNSSPGRSAGNRQSTNHQSKSSNS